MQIYLIRHAHAEDGADDAARPLSAKGRKQITEMAAFLRRNDLFQPSEFWHSPLVRARETAQLLAGQFDRSAPLAEVAGLEPEADPASMARRLARLSQPVAVVGHEPHLSALATLLLTGSAGPAAVVFRKCAVAELERTGDHWAIGWLVSPAIL